MHKVTIDMEEIIIIDNALDNIIAKLEKTNPQAIKKEEKEKQQKSEQQCELCSVAFQVIKNIQD